MSTTGFGGTNDGSSPKFRSRPVRPALRERVDVPVRSATAPEEPARS